MICSEAISHFPQMAFTYKPFLIPASGFVDRMPYCDRVSLLTIAGLLKRGSVPELVLGKAITSRMDCVPQSMAIMRSNPVKGVSFQEKTTDDRVHAKCDASMRWGTTLESTNKLLKWSLFLIIQLGNMNIRLYN